MTSSYRYARQIHQNLSLKNGIQFVRIQEFRKHQDYLILTLRAPRSWHSYPGQHVFLTVLTLSGASIFQRHPLTVTWWNASPEPEMCLMIRSRRGWTKSILDRPNLLESRKVWLDGPYGVPICLEDYGIVILFALGDGVFAQLPCLKTLTEACNSQRARMRRIKLVWLTNEFNEQLQEWMETILHDEDRSESATTDRKDSELEVARLLWRSRGSILMC